MLRKLNLLLVSILLTAVYSFSQSGLGTIRGTVSDKESKETIPNCRVSLKQNGTVKANSSTDFDGKFQINSITPGTYDVEVSNPGEGYQPSLTTGVVVSSEKITFLDNLVLGKGTDIEEVIVVAYRVPLIDRDGGASGATVTREDIARLPVRSAAGVASTVGGVNLKEGSDDISVRGSRSDGTYYYIDGIKVRGSSNLPKSAMEEVSVITGGLPANYGDATGGIISITTRGPSAKFFGSMEVITSGFYFKGKDADGYDGKVYGMDKYGYNVVEGLISGPLLMKKDSTGKKSKPLLGFLVSANFTDELDNRPLNGGSYRVKKDVRDGLREDPIRALTSPTNTRGAIAYNSDYLRSSDFEKVAWRMNARRSTLSTSGKIDVNTGPTINLTFGGSLNYEYGSGYGRNSSLLNFSNFGVDNRLDWRIYGRFTQRFTNKEEGSSSKIKSAFYSLMVDFSKQKRDQYDKRHKFELFNYGHVGNFNDYRVPTYTEKFDDNDNPVREHTSYNYIFTDFVPSTINPDLAAITSDYLATRADQRSLYYGSVPDIQAGGGLLNGDVPDAVYSLWNNFGAPFNGFSKTENDQFRVTGSGSVNIGDHSLSLGFEYEQRWDRGYTSGTNLGPAQLWTLARQRANSHITEVDKNSATITNLTSMQQIDYDVLNAGTAFKSGTGVYGGDVSTDKKDADVQSFFDYNLRKKLGLDPAGSDYIALDNIDPSMLSVDMFSAEELINKGNEYLEYWGYDHTGKKVRGATDISKYFTDEDENGNYKRFIGSYQPVYMAFYLMDKFAFNDIVFNVGVRVDVFDANQPVLKDKYLLNPAYTVSEARAKAAEDPSAYKWVNIPESMGDDYVVYVNDFENPSGLNGFRNGDTWYNNLGNVVENPVDIRGTEGIQPWIKESYIGDTKSKNPSVDAFEDYKRQVNFMPRIAFSFPISDEASFFAHYDILSKRPTTGARFNPTDYQYISSRSGRIIDNPNLLPEQTIDYELGFQQVLSKSSSLKISAFYREQRNNVQLINVLEAYPNTYKTYGNRDFGTVKGLTVSYDLRRTGNVRMTAAYTLQFADGTGSDAQSNNNLLNGLQTYNLPNLRNIFPYSYDQRHAFNVSVDYRYGSGADYNGPMVGDIELFGNTGLNILSNIYSGNPYSQQDFITNAATIGGGQTPSLTKTINGSRLPWQYRLDIQLDRTFDVELGKGDKKKSSSLQVYLRATNLLNQQNVLNVYRATGSWNDDGYLANAASQPVIESNRDAQSYRDYYTLKVQNPNNISAPRTIRLGIKFDF